MNLYSSDNPGQVIFSSEINAYKKRAQKFCACALIDTASSTEIRGKTVMLKSFWNAEVMDDTCISQKCLFVMHPTVEWCVDHINI